MSTEHDKLDEVKTDELEEQNFGVEEMDDTEDIEEIGGKVEPKFGVVNGCEKLNIRVKPNVKAEILCVVDAGSELMIDSANSTDGWFNVFTKAGIEGFCMKEYISIKE